MKKINLLFSTLVFVLALLVVGAATLVPVMQAQTMSLQPASNANGDLSGQILFDDAGCYAVDKTGLIEGNIFKFFGHDWRLTKVDDGVATFWMADPYTSTHFNKTARAGINLYQDGANIWTNGYSKTVWKNDAYTSGQENGQVILDQDGGSDIRKFLYEAAKTMLDDKAYAKYKDKVIPGFVAGHNEANDDANRKIVYMAYAKQGLTQVERDEVEADKNQLTAYFDLDSSDRLWLPSVGDLQVWQVLDDAKEVLRPNTLQWQDTTIANRVWLRNPDIGVESESYYALVLSANKTKDGSESQESYIHARTVAQAAGVRPAVHLDISKIDEEYAEHINRASSKNWWDDDWLKVLFMTVCILGVVGLTLVVVGVIVKVRRTRQTHEA
ncbi:MAG: hypothetical protein J5580_03680 [Clostridia bacterium]|nr:hypothetical protein [Clostridia bacterium]